MSDASAPSSVGAIRLESLCHFFQDPCDLTRHVLQPFRFMFLTSLVMMTQWAIFSLPSSFFPAAARSISISDSQIGMIFGAFPLGTMLGAAVATPIALRWGPFSLVSSFHRFLHFHRLRTSLIRIVFESSTKSFRLIPTTP